jgi:cell division protein FtsA
MKKRIAVIDIGSSKVCTIMASLDGLAGVKIQGMALSPVQGIDKGLLVDLIPAQQCIRDSVKRAEEKAGYRLESPFIGINGNHVHSMRTDHSFALSKTDQMVHPEDLKGVLEAAVNLKVLADRKLIQVVPSSQNLYGREVRARADSRSYDLNVESGFINRAVFSVQNLNRCLMGLGLEAESLILEHTAAAESLLSEDEKATGTLLIDIGAETTSVSVSKNGKIEQTGVVQVGGKLISGDIAAGLELSFEQAENIKKSHGAILPEGADQDDTLQIDADIAISRRDLSEIIGARVEEILRLIMLDVANRDSLTGVVLAGGSAKIPGIVELTQEITRLPARIGIPRLPAVTNGATTLADPALATSAGLIALKMRNWYSQQRIGSQGPAQGFFASVGRLFQ